MSGHADCAGNPVSDEQHKEDITKGVEVVKSWNLEVDVKGIWVDQNWVVNPI